MAQRAGATVVEVRASLVPMISKPDATTRLILEAANAIRVTPAAARPTRLERFGDLQTDVERSLARIMRGLTPT